MVARAVRWGSALAAAGVAAAVVAVAMADDRSTDSGIRGRVVACGIVHERRTCTQQVHGVTVVVRRAARARPVATVSPDARGRFRVALAPGSYVLEVRARPPAGRRLSPPRIAVVVREHAWTTVTVPAARLSPPARALSRAAAAAMLRACATGCRSMPPT